MKKRQQKRDHHQQNQNEYNSIVELQVHRALDRDADAGGNSKDRRAVASAAKTAPPYVSNVEALRHQK
jgi:hypothetical protein